MGAREDASTAAATSVAGSADALPRRIVVGVDGSEHSLEALRYATRLAEDVGADIVAVGVWTPPMGYIGLDVGPTDLREEAQVRLERSITRAFPNDPPDRVSWSIRSGEPAGVLIDESATADLIVVGSRGHGGFTGLLLGSVSAQCAAHARCPVLIFHRAATDSPRRG